MVEAVIGTMQHYGNFSHICNEPPVNVEYFDPGNFPTYPPLLPKQYMADDLMFFNAWWKADGFISYIITSCLSAEANGLLPPHAMHATVSMLHTLPLTLLNAPMALVT